MGMFKINKAVSVGCGIVRAVGYVGPVNSKELARLTGSTVGFVEQLARKLRNAGILTVKRGPGGGYFRGRSEVNAAHVADALGYRFTDDSPLGSAVFAAYAATTL